MKCWYEHIYFLRLHKCGKINPKRNHCLTMITFLNPFWDCQMSCIMQNTELGNGVYNLKKKTVNWTSMSARMPTLQCNKSALHLLINQFFSRRLSGKLKHQPILYIMNVKLPNNSDIKKSWQAHYPRVSEHSVSGNGHKLLEWHSLHQHMAKCHPSVGLVRLLWWVSCDLWQSLWNLFHQLPSNTPKTKTVKSDCNYPPLAHLAMRKDIWMKATGTVKHKPECLQGSC